MKTRRPVSDRFWEKVNKGNDCWEWQGAINAGGYGMFNFGDNWSRLAHRASYSISFGEFPENLCVCHRCDNRKCVRPDHLFLGTYLDNNLDKQSKGRMRVGSGTRHRSAKLNEEIVREMRENLRNGVTQKSLAEKFKINTKTIWQIAHNEIWKNA